MPSSGVALGRDAGTRAVIRPTARRAYRTLRRLEGHTRDTNTDFLNSFALITVTKSWSSKLLG